MSRADSIPNHAGAALRLVSATREEARPSRWFCGSCGAPAPDARTPSPYDRACRSCIAGLLVEASIDLAPAPGDAFLVIGTALEVESISPAAATLLDCATPAALGRPLGALLEAADAGSGPGDAFVRSVLTAASASEEVVRLMARPAGVFGVRLTARVGVCGPPRRLLVALDYREDAVRAAGAAAVASPCLRDMTEGRSTRR